MNPPDDPLTASAGGASELHLTGSLRAEVKAAVREVLLELLGGTPSAEAAKPAADPTKLLTPDEVAALLRTTRKAVFEKIARGTLPGVRRVGRRVLVCQGDLLRSMTEERVLSPRRSGRWR